MSAQKVFFVLPNESDTLVNAVRKARKLYEFVDNEDFTPLFDPSVLKALSAESDDQNNRRLLRIMATDFNDWKCAGQISDGVDCIHGTDSLKDTIHEGIAVAIDGGGQWLAVDCGQADKVNHITWLVNGEYKWDRALTYARCCFDVLEHFAQTREPKRVFDFDYLKHDDKKDKRDAKGRVVSKMSLSDAEKERTLHYAVGCRDEHRLLGYSEEAKDEIVVFSSQDHSAAGSHAYHGHQIGCDNRKEISRLPVKLMKKFGILREEYIKKHTV